MTRLHFIVGPTTTGKTSRSVSLAEQTGAPVLVLDRIQCFPELAVGSGRPSAAELRSTRRIYIRDCKVVDSELPAETANALLREHLARLARREPLIILEGGSVSLLQAIKADPYWKAYQYSWQRLHLKEIPTYLSTAQSRIQEMLKPSDGTRSMLDEIACLWTDARSHAVLNGIVGYRTVIAYAARYGIPVSDLPHALSWANIEHLAEEIAREYLVYARWQEGELPLSFRAPVTMPEMGTSHAA